MRFLVVGNPKNLPPSRRISSLEQSGLAHLEIMGLNDVRLVIHSDAYSLTCWQRKESPENRELSRNSISGQQLAWPGLPGIYLVLPFSSGHDNLENDVAEAHPETGQRGQLINARNRFGSTGSAAHFR